MFPIVKKIASRYNSYMTTIARARTLEVLLNSSDRLLDDAGFSRDLLEQGVAAWPWRIDDQAQQLRPIVSSLAIDHRAGNADLSPASEKSEPQVQSANSMPEDERYVA